VLARLSDIEGVRSVEVDHAGELLRIVVDRRDIGASVRQQLLDLGFASTEIEEQIPLAIRWYGPNDVFDLSREEAQVIASRAVAAFARTHKDLDPQRSVGVVADALVRCFRDGSAGSGEAGTGAARLGAAVAEAARAILPPDAAEDLGRLVRMDLASGKGGGATPSGRI
jgi:hypothetical protein